jgi:hypothetical protein
LIDHEPRTTDGMIAFAQKGDRPMMPAPKFPQYKTLIFETWPIERCIGYARNPRKNDHAVDRVASAIREFGFRVPIVAKSDGTVVDGHLRLKAAERLGIAVAFMGWGMISAMLI